jgi:hypothetical protein
LEELAMSNVQPLTEGESLAVGDQGEQVEALQQMLTSLALYQGQLDGYYGEQLEAAVRSFQNAFGHEEDGRIGAELWHEIEHHAQSSGHGQEDTPEQTSIQPGQLSEDGAWQWNGIDWVAAGSVDAGGQQEPAETAAIQVGQLSEDGHWRWDGIAWKEAGDPAQPAAAEPAAAEPAEPAGQGNGDSAAGAGQGANHPALEADPTADIPKLSQDDFHMAIADTMTVHAGENA